MISLPIPIPELEGKKIDLDITPADAMQEHRVGNKEDYDRLQRWIASFADIAYPFIDVWNFRAALSFMVYDGKGNISQMVKLTKEQQAALGITEELIEDAVYEYGAFNMSGNYPVSDEIRAKLAEALE